MGVSENSPLAQSHLNTDAGLIVAAICVVIVLLMLVAMLLGYRFVKEEANANAPATTTSPMLPRMGLETYLGNPELGPSSGPSFNLGSLSAGRYVYNDQAALNAASGIDVADAVRGNDKFSNRREAPVYWPEGDDGETRSLYAAYGGSSQSAVAAQAEAAARAAAGRAAALGRAEGMATGSFGSPSLGAELSHSLEGKAFNPY